MSKVMENITKVTSWFTVKIEMVFKTDLLFLAGWRPDSAREQTQFSGHHPHGCSAHSQGHQTHGDHGEGRREVAVCQDNH